MNKLPVFRTFGRAVGFTLWNFFTIFRLTWFPITLLFVVNFAAAMFVLWPRGVFFDGKPMVDPLSISTIIGNSLFINLLMMVLETIVIAAIAVSIHRIILFGDRKPGVWFNFPFGGTEFRYVLMGVVSTLIILAALATVMAPALYLLADGDFATFFAKLQEGFRNTKEKGVPPGFIGMMVAYFAAWIFALYFILRLMVWPPTIVATHRFALGEAWRLTRGNVWRLFGLCLLVVFVFYFWIVGFAGAAYWYYTTKMKAAAPQDETQIVEMVQTMPAAPKTVPPDTTKPADTAPAEPASPSPSEAKPAAAPDANAEPAAPDVEPGDELAFMRPYQAYAPLMWLAQLIFYMLATGFGVALLSYSYKALKGYDAHEPIPDDA